LVSCVLVRRIGGQSGTTASRHERQALSTELGVRRRVDEHVDGAVGISEPHDGELDAGRRLERADERLYQRCEGVRRPAGEVRHAGQCDDLQRSTAARGVASLGRHSRSGCLLTVVGVRST